MPNSIADTTLQHILLFDFDGVMVDSLPETVITAFNAVSGETLDGFEDLPPNFQEIFRKHRHLVRPAGDFITLANWILETGCNSDLQLEEEEWRRLLQSRLDSSGALGERFFDARRRLQAKDRKRWCGFNSRFQPFWDFATSISPDRYMILTNKNHAAVIELFDHFGASIGAHQVLSGDHGRTKFENLQTLIEKHNGTRFLLLEDQPENLIELIDRFGIDGAVADWGYASELARTQARKDGLPVVGQNEAIALCSEHLLDSAPQA